MTAAGRTGHTARIYQVFDIRTDIRPTVATIDLGALRKNADRVRAAVCADDPGVGVLAVLKADAYGHGALACARALEQKVWGFAVSLVEEGVELRRGGIEAPIVVLGCYYGHAHRDVVAYRLTPVVGDLGELERFSRAADEMAAARLGVHLKIDSGMSRLGLRCEPGLTPHEPAALAAEVAAALAHTPGVTLTGLCTHLAEADGEDPAPTEDQLRRFAAFRAALHKTGVAPATVVHAANSAGSARFPAARCDLVRPGIALFGVVPDHTPLRGLWPVMTLSTRIIALRDLPAGAHVSYGGAARPYQTTAPTRVATLPIGYADGYTRRMSGRAQVLCGGRRCPVLGVITMDMLMVDVSAVPAARLGDEVVLIGRQGDERIDVTELAAWAGTIPWEIFCAISKRVPRVYRGEPRGA